jgi:hypothetical protein
MVSCGVLFEVRTGFLNVIYKSFLNPLKPKREMGRIDEE